MDWQPIETAPKGMRVWLAYSTGPKSTDWDMVPCIYTDGGNNFCDPGWCLSPHGQLGSAIYFVPTHWMRPDRPGRTWSGGSVGPPTQNTEGS